MPGAKKLTPFLWFNNNAEEAANFYRSVFKNSKILNEARYGDSGPGPKGSILTINFELEGQEFIALNGGPHYRFNEAVSFVINCESQEDVDYYWSKLIAGGGEESQCGWLKDKFGLSWQVVPAILAKMLTDTDPKRSNRVMQAMLPMKKLDIAALEKAYRGE